VYSAHPWGRPAYGYTAKTKYQKFETNIAQERNCAATVPIPTFIFSVSDLYIPLIGLPSSAAGK
jgi:hypothetical protein